MTDAKAERATQWRRTESGSLASDAIVKRGGSSMTCWPASVFEVKRHPI